MSHVSVQLAPDRIIAAVHRGFPTGMADQAWRPALDLVWAFLRTQPGLWTHGHNVFLYRAPARPGELMSAHFGVEVSRDFVAAGEVVPVRMPAGEAAVATHCGPYELMSRTHGAIQAWLVANGRASSGVWWEEYGDPTPDPAKTETTIGYMLKQ